jgi:hypothetical protein
VGLRGWADDATLRSCVDRDDDNIRALAKQCGAGSADDVLAIAEHVMGGCGPLQPEMQFLV